ncbi:hypothetical protein CcaverHIS002_0400010 [Cutaneotrichosporon cavernicola]|uniref:Uncharacterized protein n=1 Tax=Cutaneotrichosporon cavernicola TaxID=279322 RepID=A0AA48L3A5_9TREE|nr:uncharacterized protein CcaverHIS019_0400010 [Cutaneotrichosporon cavernicola]BEI83397.1 hypothetical protein CcaverHIS002_0400010 [Cutaneotrichosporon cavernicola]BEI91181.1 hypothetical protein CcaverHIS019_0400010 [Cutaneotrichosporon cavernicola]
MTDGFDYPLQDAYPGQTTTVAVNNIPSHTNLHWLETTLMQLCTGFKSLTFGDTPPQHTKNAQLSLATTADADRALAILNTHPALRGSFVSFVLPGYGRMYPDILTPFTRRIIAPCTVKDVGGGGGGGGAAEPANLADAEWMEDCQWPEDFPTPGHVYDELIQYGPIHHVTLDYTDDSCQKWDVMVQFFHPGDAAHLDAAAQVGNGVMNFLGRNVTVAKSPIDVRVANRMADINARREERNQPPLSPGYGQPLFPLPPGVSPTA